MAYSGDKYQNCKKEGKKTKWVRCPRCDGNPHTGICRNNCDSGYKCENGKTDPYHS